jgi:hypothetical protein
LIFSSCDNKSPDNDLKKMNLNGDVILIKDGGTYIFFDDKGNIIREYNDYNPKNISISNYFYIENKLSKKISLNKSIIVEKVFNDEMQKIFNYDNNGNLITAQGLYNNKIDYNEFYLYENGKLVKDSSYAISENSSLANVTSFIYDGELLIRKEVSRKIVEKRPEYNYGKMDYKYVYYIENNIIKKEIDAEGKTLLYEYENDLKGNWIKQKKSNGDVWKREIFYKGDDISLYENKFEEIKKEISSSSSEKNKIKSNSNSQLNQKQNCNECQGTGSVSCNDCAGSGQHRCDFCKGSKIYHDDICSECRGSGMETCRTCFGKGKTKCYKCDGTGQL